MTSNGYVPDYDRLAEYQVAALRYKKIDEAVQKDDPDAVADVYGGDTASVLNAAGKYGNIRVFKRFVNEAKDGYTGWCLPSAASASVSGRNTTSRQFLCVA